MARPKTGADALGACDRCIVPTPATHTQRMSFSVGTFRLALCDPCGERFQDDMLRWSRLGTIVDERQRTFQTPAREPEPESRGTVVWSWLNVREVVATVPADDEAEDDEAEFPIVVRPRVSDENLPAGHENWSFSDHAKERLVERGLTKAEALWCAEYPDTPPRRSTSKEYPNCMVHIRGSVRVVVDPETKVIVTVMYIDVYDEQEEEQSIA